jgi:hypothetical protein
MRYLALQVSNQVINATNNLLHECLFAGLFLNFNLQYFIFLNVAHKYW